MRNPLSLRDPIELPNGTEYALMVGGPAHGKKFVVNRTDYYWLVPIPVASIFVESLEPTVDIARYERSGRDDNGIAIFTHVRNMSL